MMVRRLKRMTVIAVAVAIGWFIWNSGRVTLGPGVMAPDHPQQQQLQEEPAIRAGDFAIVPLASFNITAKVLSKKRYFWDQESKLSPVDLALGWGRMSDESILESIDIHQSRRWYRWTCRKLPIAKREIELSSANMHIIPASSEIKEKLGSVREGQIVTIEGFLVQVLGKKGWQWSSSLSRNDTGNGACEIIYARKLVITKGG